MPIEELTRWDTTSPAVANALSNLSCPDPQAPHSDVLGRGRGFTHKLSEYNRVLSHVILSGMHQHIKLDRQHGRTIYFSNVSEVEALPVDLDDDVIPEIDLTGNDDQLVSSAPADQPVSSAPGRRNQSFERPLHASTNVLFREVDEHEKSSYH